MAQPPLSDALAQEAVNAMAAHNGISTTASAALGISRGTLQGRLRVAQQRGMTPNAGTPDADDVQGLKAKVKRLESSLKSHESQSDQARQIKAVIGAMGRQVEELDPPAWLVRGQGKAKSPGVPTLFLSDLHWGETVFASQINNVNEYSVKIAHKRMDTLVSSAVHLLQIISPEMDYPGIVIPLGGDMISGNIHDELTATNELNSMPAVLDLYGVLVGVITAMADQFGHVFCPCVSGNHGRDTKKIWNKDRHHTSFDWLLYRFLAKHFDGDKRITFYIPDGSDAYYKVFNHAYLLTHGDQFRGGDGLIGCLGPIIRGDHKKRSRNAQVDQKYDTMLLGHFHSYIHHGRVIVNGSMKGYDEFAWSNNFSFEPPQQALWITHPVHGQTFRMPVFLGEKQAATAASWVSVPG